MWKWIALGLILLIVAAVAVAYARYRSAAAEAATAFGDLEARAKPAGEGFNPAALADLPEIARRYFTHAIAPGTPLSTVVRLEMEGTFLLGDKKQYQTYSMRARQVLAPPAEFVWIPQMKSGLMEISGSDALVHGEAWTRFWINGLVPVVNQQTSPDLVRSALARSAMEAVWAPASLLPGNGASWTQTGPDTARLTFSTGIEPVDVTIGATGRVLEIVTMRWSDANPEKRFRLQPFGGRVEAEATFGGFTIPSQLTVGNQFGTQDYLPFFQARITAARYLPGPPDPPE
jgi:hypothetical protein